MLTGTTVTTAAVTANCTVSAVFALDGANRQVNYVAFDNTSLSLFAWEGQKIALLSARADLRQAHDDALA